MSPWATSAFFEQQFVLLQTEQAAPELALHGAGVQLRVWGEQSLRRHVRPSGPGYAGVHADPPFTREEAFADQAALEVLELSLSRPQQFNFCINTSENRRNLLLLLKLVAQE